MATITNQQENIMKKLEELKQQMVNLKNILKTQDVSNGPCIDNDIITQSSEEHFGKVSFVAKNTTFLKIDF